MATNSLKVRNSLNLTPTSAPANPANGDIYYDSTANVFYFYQNGGWVTYGNGTNGLTWLPFTFTNSSFSTAALTNTITLYSLPSRTMIHNVMIKHSTAFSGTSITAYTVSVGAGANNVQYAQAFNVFQAVADSARSITTINDMPSFSNPTTLTISATSTGANLSAATTGAVEVWLLVSLLP